MIRKSHNYGAFWLNRSAHTTRATAFAYWEQASRFEQQARERGDVATANFQKHLRMERENQLAEFDAMEGGNI